MKRSAKTTVHYILGTLLLAACTGCIPHPGGTQTGPPAGRESADTTRGAFERDTLDFGALFPVEQPAAPSPGKKRVPRGGSVVIHGPCSFTDPAFRRLVSVDPCMPADGPPGLFGSAGGRTLFSIRRSSKRTVELTIADSIPFRGAVLSAFDLVESWNRMIERFPAEALFLFRHVAGIRQYIEKTEGIVSGFSVQGPRTVSIRYEREDPHALTRLCTPRLVPVELGCGPYRLESFTGGKARFRPVAECPFVEGGFLDALTILTRSESYPLLEFSLGNVDGVVLTMRADVEYAGKNIPGASLKVFDRRYYFCSIAAPDPAVRERLWNSIEPGDMVAEYVHVDAAPIASLHGLRAPPPLPSAGPLPAGDTCRVVYCTDDTVSFLIAEKLLADLSLRGFAVDVDGYSPGQYQRALIRGEYTIAVGWVPASIRTREAERIRCATLWFADETNEEARIQSFREKPLFSVTRYLLHTSSIHCASAHLHGMYRSTETAPKEE